MKQKATWQIGFRFRVGEKTSALAGGGGGGGSRCGD